MHMGRNNHKDDFDKVVVGVFNKMIMFSIVVFFPTKSSTLEDHVSLTA
jgi:hypothetical protein